MPIAASLRRPSAVPAPTRGRPSPAVRARARGLLGVAGLVALGLLVGCASPASPPAAPPAGKPAATVTGSAAAGSAAPAAVAPTPQAPRQLKVGYAATNPRVAPLWLAAEEGFFQRHGLEVESISMRSAPALQAAMIAREIQLGQSGLVGTLQARAGGAGVIQLGGLVDKPLAHLVASPSIRRPEDLRGKRLGVQAIGGTVWARGILALERLGLEPERDNISILIIGDEPTLGQAIVAGAIDAAPVGTTVADPLRQQGYMTWDLAALGVPEIGQAFVTSESFIQAEPDTVERFLRSMAETMAFMKGMTRDPTRRELILSSAGRNLRVPPEATASEIDALVPLIPENLLPSRAAMETIYALSVRENPDLSRVPLDAALDERILRRLEQEGYFRQLYANPP
jgi:ABC-type nitrate/sulfonate/bicarbonate transport system substrate-binding protein